MMQRHLNTIAIGAVVFAIAMHAIATHAAETDGAFKNAIAAAQARTVKIYGAGIGRVTGYGTGILVSANGEILTTQGAYLSTENLRVGTPDGKIHRAKIVRRDIGLQLALLSIEADTPDYFSLNAKPVKTGDWVLAVTNAFKVADGEEPLSVTLGVVSLRTRLDARRGFHNVDYTAEAILIDAITSNPGASGGAVVTAQGELAGMVGKVAASNQTGTRLNYAVPADILADFIAGKTNTPAVAEIKKGDLGIRLFRLGGRNAPAFIDRVIKGSAADKAGLKSDDLVVAIDGRPIKNAADFTKQASAIVADKEILVIVKRNNELIQTPITPTAAQ